MSQIAFYSNLILFYCNIFSGETPVLYQVLAERRGVTAGMMASTHVYDMTGAGGNQPPAALGNYYNSNYIIHTHIYYGIIKNKRTFATFHYWF